ncbi:MAG TPA: hypothetical protein VK404_15520 [Spirosoma sp.]|nr:hypothetical protein [Spirosoma sp.]
MWIDFDKLPDDARVWVYQANRPLSDGDVTAIYQALQLALSQWAAHGQSLLASAQVVENRFVVVGVDEGYNLPSGCSIDSSVRTLRQIGESLSIDFFDRSAAIKDTDGSVHTIELPGIKAAVLGGNVTPDTTVFNTLVKTKAEFLTNWHLRAGDSWLKRYLRPKAV